MRAAPRIGRSGTARRRRVALAAGAVTLVLLAGCSLFGQDKKGHAVSALAAKPGDCVIAPTAISAEIKDVTVVPCSQPHQQEVYALAAYPLPAGTEKTAAYPGAAVLKAFADGA